MNKFSYVNLGVSVIACCTAIGSVFLRFGEPSPAVTSITIVDNETSKRRVEVRPGGIACFDEAGRLRMALMTSDETPTIALLKENGDPTVVMQQRPDGNTSLSLGRSKNGPLIQMLTDKTEGGKFFLCTAEGEKVAMITVVDGNYGTVTARSVKEPMISNLFCRGLSVLNKELDPTFFAGVDGYSQPLCVFYGPGGKRELELSRVEGQGSVMRFFNQRGAEVINMAASEGGGSLQINDGNGTKVQTIGADGKFPMSNSP